MTNHPNRSRAASAARNPRPADIRAARENAGLSQSAAGVLVHRSLRNWQQFELGERRMDPAIWELFCIKIGIPFVIT